MEFGCRTFGSMVREWGEGTGLASCKEQMERQR